MISDDEAVKPAAADRLARPARALHEHSLTEMLSLTEWRWFVPETLGLVLIILWLQAKLPEGTSGAGAMPHPLWIPVLLMCSQYGIMGGLFATLAASAAIFCSGLPPQSASQDFYAYAGLVAAQPCAWFASSLILGGVRSLHIHNQSALQERLEQSQEAAEDLADNLERAIEEVGRLEQRIASDSSTLTVFLHGLAKLELRDPLALLASIADVIRYGVGAASFAIYLDGGHGLAPCLGIEDGARVKPNALAPVPPEVASAPAGAHRVGTASDLVWAPIQARDGAGLLGVVVCRRLLPSRDPAIAARRLNEVCCVLAVLLSACSESVHRTCAGEKA